MSQVKIVSKESHNVLLDITTNKAVLTEASVVIVKVNPTDIQQITRNGNNAVITLKSGKPIVIVNFFPQGSDDSDNSLVFEDDQHQLKWVQFLDANGAPLESVSLTNIESIEPLLYSEHTISPWAWLAVPAIAAGIAIAANNKDSTPEKDTTAPNAPMVNPPNAKDPLKGTAEPGSTVVVTFPDGSKGSTVAGADGKWSIPNPGLKDGDKIKVTATDPSGNTSPETNATIDGIAPNAPVVNPPNANSPITGTAEPGSIVKVTYPDGSTGSVVADKDGKWALPNPGLKDGDIIKAVATDPSGNTSLPTTATVDGIAPNAPVVNPPNAKDDLTGTAEPGSEVKVTYPDGSTGTAVADKDGTWSIPNLGLKDGDQIKVIATDPSGNISPPTTATVDGIAPNAPVVNPPNAKDDLTGTAEPGSEVKVTYPDGSTGTAVTDQDGHWSIPNPGLKDGDQIKVIATDPSGNISPPTTATVDGVAPNAPVVNPPNAKDDLTGTAEPGSEVKVTYPDGSTGTTVADKDGIWSIPNPGLKDGDQIKVTATDPSGNISPPTTATVDGIAPNAPVVNPPNAKDDLTGTAEPGSEVKVTYPDGSTGTTVAGSDGKWSIPNPGLKDGDVIKVIATDLAGNASPETAATIDGIAPNAPVVNPPNAKDDLTGTAEPGSEVKVTYPDGSTGTTVAGSDGTWLIPNPGLKDGDIIKVIATDSAGNASPETAATIDGIAPNAPVVNPPNANAPITGTAEPGSTVKVTYPDGSTDTVVTAPDGTWSLPNPGLKDGDVIKVIATDPAGNASPETAATIDGIAPNAPVVNPPNANDPITGTAEPGSMVKVTYPDGSTDTVVTAPDGTWSLPNPGLKDGDVIKVTATDLAGNTSPETNATIDGIAPIASAANGYEDNVGAVQSPTSTASVTDDNTPGINIGAGLTDTAKLYVDGVLVAATYDPITGTLTPNTAVADGLYNFSYSLTDAAGNESAQSPALKITVDTSVPTTPTAPNSYDDNVGTVQSSTSTAPVTDDNTPGINVGVGLTDTPKLYVDGVLVAVTYDPVTGTLTPNTALVDGLHNMSYTLTNAAGNESAQSPSLVITIDTLAPTTPSTAPSNYDDNVGAVQSPTSTAPVTDDNTPGINVGTGLTDTAKLYVDGVLVAATYDPITGTLTPNTAVADGLYNFSYSLTDAAGNESAQSPALKITVDTSVPTTPTAPNSYDDNVGTVQSSTSTAPVTDDNTPGINVGAGLTDTPKLYVDGVLVAAIYDPVTGTLTPNTALADGLHNMSYTLTNAAGSESAQSPSLAISIDTLAPTTPSTAPSSYNDNVGAVQSPTSTAPVTDDNTPGINVGAGLTNTPKLYVDGVLVAATYDPITGTLTPNTAVADGLHNFSYSLTDAAGNESAQSPALKITVDTSVPVAPTVPNSYDDNVGTVQSSTSTAPVTDDNTPGINVGAGLTNTPKLYVDGVLVAATYDPVTGTLTPNTALADGLHNMSYTLTNAAGSESAQSPSLAISIDTLAPTTPSTAPSSYNDNVGAVQSPTSTAPVTDDNTPGINVGTNLVDKPKLYVDGVLVAATYDPITGTLTPNTAVADGLHNFSYSLTDAAGNESAQSPALKITVDTSVPVAPTVPNSYDDNVGAVQSPTSTALVTDDNTPGINVGAGLTNTPKLYVDGVLVAATYDPVTGTLTPNTALADGLHNMSYTLTNAAGSESAQSPSLAITVDTLAPTTPTTAPSSYNDNVGAVQSPTSTAPVTDDNTPGINVGANLVDKPKLYVDGVLVAATYDPVIGTLTPNTAVADGLHNFSYSLTDAAGNESAQSPSLAMTVDTSVPTAPTAPSSYDDNVGTVQSPTSTAPVTDDNTPGINVGMNLTTTPKLYVDGVLVAATYDPIIGTLTPNTAVADGLHNFSYSLTDAAGNESAQSPALKITVDTSVPVAPTVPNSYDDNVGTVQSSTSTAPVTDDNTPGINVGAGLTNTPKLYVDGVLVAAIYNPITGTLTPNTAVADGLHNFSYSLTDAAGNESAQSPPLTITVDTSVPAMPTAPNSYDDNVGAVQSPTSTAPITDDNTPGLNVGVNLTDTPKLYVDGVLVASTYNPVTGTLTPNTALADGLHNISYSLVNAAGSESAQSPSMAITVDTLAPPAPTAPSNYDDNVGAVQSSTSTASITDDSQPGINVGSNLTDIPKLYIDGVLVAATYDPVTGTLTPNTPLADGAHNFSYTVTDAAGNESAKSPSLALTVDTSVPATPVAPSNYDDNVGAIQNPISTAAVTDDNTPGINVGTNLTTTPKLYVDGVLVAATYNPVTGTLTPNTPLADGLHQFSYSLTNAAGSESAKSPALTITIDTSVPATPTAPSNYDDNVGAVQSPISTAPMTDDNTPGINVGVNRVDTPKLYVDGVLVAATYNPVTGTLTPNTPLADGLHQLSYSLTNAAGTESAKSAALAITIDTAAPATPTAPTSYDDNVGSIQNPTSTALVTDDNRPGINVGANLTTPPKLYVDGVLVAATYDPVTGTLTPNTALADGSHSFSYTVTNAAGTESAKSPALTISIDTSVPVAPTGPLNYDDNVGPIQSLTSTAAVTDDNTPGLNIGVNLTTKPKLYIDGVLVASTYDPVTGTLTPNTAVLDGVHNFSYSLTNAAGSESAQSPSLTLTIDTVAPTTPAAPLSYNDNVGTLQSPTSTAPVTDDNTPGINVGAGLTDTPRLYINGIFVAATYNSVTGTLTPNTPLVDGLYNFSFTLTDGAGNESAKSPALVITIDTTAPTETVLITSYTDDVGLSQGNFGSGTITDDRTPVLNGTTSVPLAAGDQVAIYNSSDNSFVGYATTTGQSWSYVLNNLSDSTTYNYYSAVVDSAGNIGAHSPNFSFTVSLNITVNTESTTDSTPLITGAFGFTVQAGEYLEVTINGVVYSSQTGAVVIDTLNNTWYVQIPNTNALATGIYEVSAQLKDAIGIVASDHTSNELTIAAAPSITFTATGASSQDTGSALTISENGAWRLLSNSSVFTQNSTNPQDLSNFNSVTLVGIDKQQQSTFIDFDRDGRMDILGADTSYGNGQQSFKYNADGTYSTFQVGSEGIVGQPNNGNANTYVWFGGAVGIDMDGDGFVDIIYGDKTPNDAAAWGGYNTAFVLNTNGTIAGFAKTGTYTAGGGSSQNGVPSTNNYNSTPDRELSGVDFNNDGYVDIVYHGSEGGNTNSQGGVSTDNSRLTFVQNGVDTSGKMTLTNTQIVTGVFQGNNETDNQFTSMTWADLNGDGFMDLVIAGQTSGANAANTLVFYNDGTGNFTTGAKGVGTASNMQNLADKTNSNTSLAVDWNGDGKMDLIEIAGASNGTAAATNLGLLWLNNGTGAGGQVNWTQQTLLGKANLSAANFVAGAQLLDLDWDGDQDLVVFRAQGGASSYIENKTVIQDGSSIVLRILDKNGINAYFGNTVALVDEATGQVVATQIINAQSGVNTQNSTGLVYFYGLDASKSYSAVLLSHGNDFGGVSSVTFGSNINTIENVNSTWSGLKAIEKNHDYVLTAENGTAASNTGIAATDGTNQVGIVGTGYNDTFYATAGSHTYNGAGGSEFKSGVWNWTNNGGVDIVDYKLVGTTALTIDLSNTAMQNTGFGQAKFINIEGIAGAGGNDVFTDNAGNNQFEGRGGNDTFNLINGGNDTLLYKLLNAADATGGNGVDQVNGFHVGTWEATLNADRINVHDLLQGFTGTSDNQASFINGVATMSAGSTIQNYLTAVFDGTNTQIQINTAGQGANYTTLLTLNNTHVDLATLLANHQLVLG